MAKRWLSLSLEKKVRWIAACAGAVVFFSIGANLLVAGFGLGGFGKILDDNAASLAFWSAMESERLAFERYADTSLPEEKERFLEAKARTRRCLDALPLDYRETGPAIYARTWSIRNMYENYEAETKALWEMNPDDSDYVERLYQIYRLQGYIKDKAGQLEQLTMEAGNARYESQRPLLVLLPLISILWGAAALWMV